MEDILSKVVKNIEQIKINKPLIHCLTNSVSMRDCANIILAIGGSPTMAEDIAEVEEVVKNASALVINIGTISKEKVESMIKAGKVANKIGVPVILDPVGVASLNNRRNIAFRILEQVQVSVIRGNMAEIKILLGLKANSKGVDSEENESVETSSEIAKQIAKEFNSIVCITGKVDYISDGKRVIKINNGCEMLTKVTGSGCMTTALIGTCLGVNKDYLIATISGILVMGIAGELSYEMLKDNEGVGTFLTRIFDKIYLINDIDIKERGRVYE